MVCSQRAFLCRLIEKRWDDRSWKTLVEVDDVSENGLDKEKVAEEAEEDDREWRKRKSRRWVTRTRRDEMK